jgi:hypothetical protein
MKLTLLPVVALCALLAGGCASSNSGSESAKAKSAEDQLKDQQYKNQREKDPAIGQTKDEIMALYGKPDSVSISSDGEVWSYHVNRGAQFIPYNFGYRPKFRTVTFNKEGKVAHWTNTQ